MVLASSDLLFLSSNKIDMNSHNDASCDGLKNIGQPNKMHLQKACCMEDQHERLHFKLHTKRLYTSAVFISAVQNLPT